MLVFTRKQNESIKIKVTEEVRPGDDVTIWFRSIDGARISVAVDAPKRVPVVRGELDARPQPPRAA